MKTALCAIAAFCTAALPFAASGGEIRATGFRPPPFRMKITKAEGAKDRAKRLRSTPLPASWDSRAKGWVTPVKDQDPLGTCWTFSANAVIETQLLRTGRGEWDFSEKNMTLLSGFDGDWNSGGSDEMAAAYLLRWGGAVAETNDVYLTRANGYYSKSTARDEWENVRPSHPHDSALHIQNVVWIPALDGTEATRNELKSAITNYGAVSTCIYAGGTYLNANGAYYCKAAYGCNHAVTVVGWDDNYSTNNFTSTCRPPDNGAWLVKNSWGIDNGDEGYWHVSYFDKNFATYLGAVFIPATESENYTAVYGYDRHGVTYDFVQEHVEKSPYFDPFDLMAAVFTSGWNEELAAVGVYTFTNPCPYEISIYTNVTRNAETPTEGGVLAFRMTGALQHAGFTTVPLPSPIHLADRTTFSVVFRQTGNGRSNPLCCTYIDYCYPNLDLGQSYFGYSGTNGEEDVWIDGADKDIIAQVDYTDEAWAACIKAYTRSTVPAKKGDAPGEADDGTEALADLAATNALAYAQHGETFGAFANIVGANGRTLWTSWLAGLDPADPASDFRLFITVTNNIPSLAWTPDLGEERKYTIKGSVTPFAGGDWPVLTKEELADTSNRFFKVSLSPCK